MKGVLNHVAAAGRNKDHIVAVVDVRRSYFYPERLPETFIELLDCGFACRRGGRLQGRVTIASNNQVVDHRARQGLGLAKRAHETSLAASCEG